MDDNDDENFAVQIQRQHMLTYKQADVALRIRRAFYDKEY